MSRPNVGANFFHKSCPIWVVYFILYSFILNPPLGQGDGCAQLDLMGSKKVSAHVACSMTKGKSSNMTSCGPPTLRVTNLF